MNEKYLWDRSGEPDLEVERLERLLGQFRESGKDNSVALRAHLLRAREKTPMRFRVAAAAVLALASVISLVVYRARVEEPATAWTMSVEGRKAKKVRTGQIIQTVARTHGRLESPDVGEVDIQPESTIRVLGRSSAHAHLALDRGTIHAFIWARPAEFVVDTPSARTIDLGCQYTLRVDGDGSGFLTVETGWVAFQWNRVESFIPAGAACATHRERGPDPPYFLDASAAFRQSLQSFDRRGDRSSLESVLVNAQPRDALTLWHLLNRAATDQRPAIVNRFAQLVTLPGKFDRGALLRGDPLAVDAAWNALDLGDTSWWREWKRRW